MPTYRSLSINDINEMMINGFLPLGLLDKPITKVDGVMYNFYHFFMHDVNHALDFLKEQNDRFNYNEWEGIRAFLRDWRRRFPEGPFLAICRASWDRYQRSTEGPFCCSQEVTLAFEI